MFYSGIVLSAVLLLSLLAVDPVRLYPIDDTPRDPGFRSFVKKLESAVRAHDVAALKKLTDPEVVSGPAKDDTGWEKFIAEWKPDERDSELWSVLADLLSVGFVREHPRLFLSPYVAWRFPKDLDRRNYLVVVRDKAPLRDAPSVRAPEVETLSFDIVERLSDVERGEGLGEWMRVKSFDGKIGFLNLRDAMSPLMPHGQFGQVKGKWMMIALER